MYAHNEQSKSSSLTPTVSKAPKISPLVLLLKNVYHVLFYNYFKNFKHMVDTVPERGGVTHNFVMGSMGARERAREVAQEGAREGAREGAWERAREGPMGGPGGSNGGPGKAKGAW
jgi:hypothetical protein